MVPLQLAVQLLIITVELDLLIGNVSMSCSRLLRDSATVKR